MRQDGRILPSGLLFGLAAALLVAGLAVDLGYTQPRVREVRQLGAQRTALLERLAEATGRDREGRALARLLERNDLAAVLAGSGQESDPVTYLDEALEAAELTRLGLTTTENSESNGLRRTRIVLRVLGSYARIVDFMRTIERASRLVTIDVLAIEAAGDSKTLEARLGLTIHDPEEAR